MLEISGGRLGMQLQVISEKNCLGGKHNEASPFG